MEHAIKDAEAVCTALPSLSPSPSPSASRPVRQHGGEGGHEGSSVAQASEGAAMGRDDHAMTAVGTGDEEPERREGGHRG